MRCIMMLGIAGLASCSAAEPRQSKSLQATSIQPFPDAAEVRLFIFAGETDAKGHIVFVDPKGHMLSQLQRSQFERSLRVEKRPEIDTACFIPHHFFRYFDKQHRQIGEIAVCFCCASVSVEGRSTIRLGADQEITADYGALKSLVAAMGERTDIKCD